MASAGLFVLLQCAAVEPHACTRVAGWEGCPSGAATVLDTAVLICLTLVPMLTTYSIRCMATLESQEFFFPLSNMQAVHSYTSS